MDGYFYDELYKSGAKKKSFVWSIAFNKPVFKGEKIELEGNEVNMTLKFEEAQTALIYYSSLLNMKNKAFPIGDNNEIDRSILIYNQNPDALNTGFIKVADALKSQGNSFKDKKTIQIFDKDKLEEYINIKNIAAELRTEKRMRWK